MWCLPRSTWEQEAQLREEQQALMARVDQTERLVEDAGGAMDDIAVRVDSKRGLLE